MNSRRTAAPLALFLLLAGCAVPHIEPALAPLGAQALGLGGGSVAPIAAPIADDWWTGFGDPQLDRIIADALARNPTLDGALARLRLAESALSTARARRRPQVALDGNEQVQRLSEAYIIPPPYGGSVRAVGELEANLAHDLDFWGRQADLVRQARAAAGAAARDGDAARLALSGAVAEAYVGLARAEREAENARLMIETRDRALRLLRLRSASRLDSDFNIRGAETLAAQARQALLRAEAERASATHALALLAGGGAGYAGAIGPASLSMDGLATPAGELPADLLSRRPDVLGARLSVEAAAADREVARKDFYPNVNLLGIAGFQAMGLDRLLSGGAVTYGGGAAIHLPIFDGGQLRANYAGSTARLDAAIAAYNETVLGAIREAADASTLLVALDRDLAAQRQAVAGLAGQRSLGEVRLATGLGTRLDLTDADMQLLAAHRQTIDLEASRAIAGIRLLVALGGGFDAGNLPPVARVAAQGNEP